MHFPVSGVDCPIWLPPAVAFTVALLTTPAGVSGAFLLLPFQMSVLGFVSPAVTPTKLIYNVVSVPGGVVKYIKDHRMVWPIAWVIAVGTLPGIFVGSVIRIHYLPDPRYCKSYSWAACCSIWEFDCFTMCAVRGSRGESQRVPE